MSNLRENTSQTMSLSDAIKTSAHNMLFDTLLNNPDKRAKVLELLTQEGIVGSDENSSPNSNRSQKYFSPIKKLQKSDSLFNRTPKSKTDNVRMESPSALGRRRALQRLESDSSAEEHVQKVPSPQFVGDPKPFDRLLEGVVAFCEIRSNGEDRSSAIKTMMQSMGAKVKDNLCRGVTHVVLKDGLYTTYRKAKLLKIHVVSVLWLEAVRRHKFRVPESKFPAVCADAYDADITKICQEIQKDYNDVIQDELNHTTQQVNGRRSETPITKRKKSMSRSTVYGSECAGFKEAHNRTEIAAPYKFRCEDPDMSESDSYISVGSTSNKSLDIVPSSQDAAVSLPEYKSKKPALPIISDDDESDNCLPKSNLANHVKDSFELEKAAKIRSPESLLSKSKRRQKAVEDIQRISNETEDSLVLRISITDDSSLNNTRDASKSNPDSSKNILGNISLNDKRKNRQTTDDDKSSSLNLHLSEDSHDSAKNIPENKSTSWPNSRMAASSSDVDLNKNKTKRWTVGLRRPTNKSANETSEKNISKDITDSTASFIEINNSDMDQKEYEIKRNRRKTIYALNNTTVEEKDTVRRTRRKTTVNVSVENKTNPAKISEEVNEESSEKNISEGPTPTRKSRRKTIANSKTIIEINENINEEKTKKPENANCKTIVEINENKNEEKTKETKNSTSDSSTEKTKRRVRKLYNPNRTLSVSQIIWDDEPQQEEQTSSASPPTKSKYIVPIKELPKILSARAQRIKSTVKSTAKSVPAKPAKTTDNNKKRKSVRALNFDSTSSETSDLDINKLKTVQTAKPSIRRSERISKTPAKKLIIESDKSSDSELSDKISQRTVSTQSTRTQLLKNKFPSSAESPNKRRSTLDFIPKKKLKALSQSQKTKQPIKLPSIVCTKLHRPDTQVFQQIVKKLGGFVVEDEVTKRTTHLVAGTPTRTVNMLRAIVRGCWVLNQEWLFKSLEAGKWLQEDDFEMVEFSPTVQKCRLEKQSFGSLYSMDLFISCGPIYISRGSTPRYSDLEELVQLCRGRVVRNALDAQVVVAEHADHEGVVCVNEKWILDSITFYKMKKFRNYLLRKDVSPVLSY